MSAALRQQLREVIGSSSSAEHWTKDELRALADELGITYNEWTTATRIQWLILYEIGHSREVRNSVYFKIDELEALLELV